MVQGCLHPCFKLGPAVYGVCHGHLYIITRLANIFQQKRFQGLCATILYQYLICCSCTMSQHCTLSMHKWTSPYGAMN